MNKYFVILMLMITLASVICKDCGVDNWFASDIFIYDVFIILIAYGYSCLYDVMRYIDKYTTELDEYLTRQITHQNKINKDVKVTIDKLIKQSKKI